MIQPSPAVTARPGRRVRTLTAGVAGLLGVVTLVAVPAAAPVAATPYTGAIDQDRISFAPGTDNATREGDVDEGATDRWVLTARAGQQMQLTVDSVEDTTVFTVFAPDRSVLATVASNTPEGDVSWSGSLPASGDYSIEVTSVDGPTYYRLKVWIDAGFVDPLGLLQRITFAPGTSSATVSGAAIRATEDLWFVAAGAGQAVSVSVTSLEANSTFDVYAADGTPLTAPDDRTQWNGLLPTDGDFRIGVRPTRANTTYTLTVGITGGAATTPQQAPPNPAPPPPVSGDSGRITFDPGTDQATISNSIAPGTVDRWVLGAAAGQLMGVSIFSDIGLAATVYAPDGSPLASGFEYFQPLPVDGDYVVEVANDTTIVGAYEVTIAIRS